MENVKYKCPNCHQYSTAQQWIEKTAKVERCKIEDIIPMPEGASVEEFNQYVCPKCEQPVWGANLER